MPLSDEQLWMLCLKNDNDAFKEVYSRYYPLLYNYGVKFVADKEFVKDCIQDFFIKLIQNHKNLSPTTCLKGYMLKAFRNKLFDSLEKEKHTLDIDEYQDTFSADELFQSIFLEENENKSESKRLMKAFKLLPARQQEILYLYFVNDLKHKDLVEVMELNLQSSKNLLFRALTNLKKLYFDEQ